MRLAAKVSRRSFVAVALGTGFVAAALGDEPKVSTPAYNSMTDEQEIELGRKIWEGLEKEGKVTWLNDEAVDSYASGLLEQIAKTSRRPKMPYMIRVVNTKQVNAVALPGGRVLLYRGLLEWAQNESQLTAVLSHEVGHVVGRHSANALSREASLGSLVDEASKVIFGDDLPARILKEAGGPVASLALLRYSRFQEAEADLLGYYNMQRAGWDAQGMVELFHRFGQESQSNPLFDFLSTHPDPAFRENQVRDEMKQFPPTRGLIHDSPEFVSARAAVMRLPRPRN